MTQALVTIPKVITRGEVIEVRCLLGHPMESGFRAGVDGKLLARNIVTLLRCTYAGVIVFEVQLMNSIASNPYVSFNLRAERSGSLRVEWIGDQGFVHQQTVTIELAS